MLQLPRVEKRVLFANEGGARLLRSSAFRFFEIIWVFFSRRG